MQHQTIAITLFKQSERYAAKDYNNDHDESVSSHPTRSTNHGGSSTSMRTTTTTSAKDKQVVQERHQIKSIKATSTKDVWFNSFTTASTSTKDVPIYSVNVRSDVPFNDNINVHSDVPFMSTNLQRPSPRRTIKSSTSAEDVHNNSIHLTLVKDV